MYFGYFLIISPWKRAEPFIWTNFIHFHLRMPCAKFGWKWLSGSGWWNCEKFRQQRWQQRGWRTTAFGSGELKTLTKTFWTFRTQRLEWDAELTKSIESTFMLTWPLYMTFVDYNEVTGRTLDIHVHVYPCNMSAKIKSCRIILYIRKYTSPFFFLPHWLNKYIGKFKTG